MRKPKDFPYCFSLPDNYEDCFDIYTDEFLIEKIPELIKWLEKVQKYNEFKNKQKRKKVKK